MQVGQEYRIKIRISKKNADLLDQNKPINQKGIKSIITLENIRVSNVMSATLNGNKDEYHIESNSTETQDIEDQGYTEWEWTVEPLKGGMHILKLIVKVKSEKDDAFKDIVGF